MVKSTFRLDIINTNSEVETSLTSDRIRCNYPDRSDTVFVVILEKLKVRIASKIRNNPNGVLLT